MSASDGEMAYIKKEVSETYDKYEDKKCSENNIGSYSDDECEERCDNDNDCSAFVIISSTKCKLYGMEVEIRIPANATRPCNVETF